MKDDQFIKHMEAMNRIADELRVMRHLLLPWNERAAASVQAMLKRAKPFLSDDDDVTLEPRDFDDRPADYDEDHPEDPTPAAVDPDHTFVTLGDAADAVVKTSMQRACEGAGWLLVDRDQDTWSFMNEAGMGYICKKLQHQTERDAWAALYDYVQKEAGFVVHDDAHLLRVAKAIAADMFPATAWEANRNKDYFVNLARVAIETYEAFK